MIARIYVFTTFILYNVGVVFNRLDDGNIEYTLRLRPPSNDSWDTGSRGSTTQLGARTSKYIGSMQAFLIHVYLCMICMH